MFQKILRIEKVDYGIPWLADRDGGSFNVWYDYGDGKENGPYLTTGDKIDLLKNMNMIETFITELNIPSNKKSKLIKMIEKHVDKVYEEAYSEGGEDERNCYSD